MNSEAKAFVDLSEGRFSRFEAIEWWDQDLLARAKVFVAGAGALGNEVIKNLALLGIGHLIIADMDHVELTNLSRSVLYREEDEGKLKAECAARAAKDIYPDINVIGLPGDMLGVVGYGCFYWADVVIGAVDNREGRVFINKACAKTARPWIDGGIEVLNGIVRAFGPPQTACYECIMSKVDWNMLNSRRSCSLLARRAIQKHGTPTTPTTASVIGGIQAQEAIKLIHGRDDFIGHGFFFDGVTHQSYPITYDVNPECEWHENPDSISSCPNLNSHSTLAEVWAAAEQELGRLDELELSREIVRSLDCPTCGDSRSVFRPLTRVADSEAWCAVCQIERTPSFLHCIRAKDQALLNMSLFEIGLPRWDVIWARRGKDFVGIEIAGDNFFNHTDKSGS